MQTGRDTTRWPVKPKVEEKGKMAGLISENNLWKENTPETKNIRSQGFQVRVN